MICSCLVGRYFDLHLIYNLFVDCTINRQQVALSSLTLARWTLISRLTRVVCVRVCLETRFLKLNPIFQQALETNDAIIFTLVNSLLNEGYKHDCGDSWWETITNNPSSQRDKNDTHYSPMSALQRPLMDRLGSDASAHGHHRVMRHLLLPWSCQVIKVPQALPLRSSQAPGSGCRRETTEPPNHRARSKNTPGRGWIRNPPPGGISFPPKKTSHFSLSLSLAPSLCAPICLHLYPSPSAVSPTTIMDLAARCLCVLSCLGVVLAIDVESGATSEPIDYKDPCKAGEMVFPLFCFFPSCRSDAALHLLMWK